jgi:hypothetical protein
MVWADEPCFPTSGFRYRPMVIRNPQEESHVDCMLMTFGIPAGRAWRGALRGYLKSRSCFVRSKVAVDSAVYTTEILDPYSIPFCHQACEECGWARVVEDNAPGYQKWAKVCRELNRIDSIP